MRAIDVHVHPMTKEYFDAFGKFVASSERMFKRKYVAKSEEEMADDFRRDDVLGMVIAWDAQAATGEGIITNDFVAGLSRKFPMCSCPAGRWLTRGRGKSRSRKPNGRSRSSASSASNGSRRRRPFSPNDRRFYPFWDLLAVVGRADAHPHRHDGDRLWRARRRRHLQQIRPSHPRDRRRRGGFSQPHHRRFPSRLAVDGRADRHRAPQGQRLYRYFGLAAALHPGIAQA